MDAERVQNATGLIVGPDSCADARSTASLSLTLYKPLVVHKEPHPHVEKKVGLLKGLPGSTLCFSPVAAGKNSGTHHWGVDVVGEPVESSGVLEPQLCQLRTTLLDRHPNFHKPPLNDSIEGWTRVILTW